MRASASDRTVACPYSLVAPQTLVRRTSASAEYGTAVHRWKETGEIPFGPDGKLLEKKLLLSGADRGILWPMDGEHEVTFAIGLVEPSVVMYGGPRDGADSWKASWPLDHLTGTADYVGAVGWVDDLKTGRRPVIPAESMQLRSYALAGWLSAGRPARYSVMTTITQWPKYPLAAPPVRSEYALTGFDLEEHLERLRYAVAHTEEANIGECCTFCDARESHAASSWMQSWNHRAMPCCAKGACAVAHNTRPEMFPGEELP